MNFSSPADDLQDLPQVVSYQKTRLRVTCSWAALSLLFLIAVTGVTVHLPVAAESFIYAAQLAGVLWLGLVAIWLPHDYLLERNDAYGSLSLRKWLRKKLVFLVVTALLAVPLVFVAHGLMVAFPFAFIVLPIAVTLVGMVRRSLKMRTLSKQVQSREKLERPDVIAALKPFLRESGINADDLWVVKSVEGEEPLRPTAYMWQEGGGNAMADELLGESPSEPTPITYRVLFTDTLFKALTGDEICAVCLHELGHKRFGHVQSRGVVEILGGMALRLAALICCFVAATAITGLASSAIQLTPVVFIALMLGGIGIDLWEKAHIRSQEYQCDGYAVDKLGSADSLCSALASSCRAAGMNPNTPYLYVLLFCDHPSITSRIERARRRAPKQREPGAQ